MRTFIVGFSRSTKPFSPFSRSIQLWDNCPYSHVYFEFETKLEVTMIYQASQVSLNYMCKDVFLDHNEVVETFQIVCTDEQYEALMTSCMKNAGKPYGVLQIVGIVIADVLELNHNPFPSSDKYVCSEWVAEELQKLGYKFDKPLDLIKPINVNKVLKEQKILTYGTSQNSN